MTADGRGPRPRNLYSDYESDEENGRLDMTAAREVADITGLPENLRIRNILAGRYRKFVVRGDVQAPGSVSDGTVSMNLNRNVSRLIFKSNMIEWRRGGDSCLWLFRLKED